MEIEDVKRHTKLLIDGTPYDVEEMEFVKPGKGRAIYKMKLRNLADGSTLSRTYHSGEKVEQVSLNTLEGQYLYKEGSDYIFMNTENFEQFPLTEAQLGDKRRFLKEGTVVTVLLMGDKPLDVTTPNFVELKVLESAVTTRTDTVTAQTKSAKLETGYSIEVPTFIKPGDVIKIDTRSGSYLERVSTGK